MSDIPKKKSKALIIVIILVLMIKPILNLFCSLNDDQLLNQLEGEIHYIKRVDGGLHLYKGSASLADEELLLDDKINNFYFDGLTGKLEIEVTNGGRCVTYKMERDFIDQWIIYDKKISDFDSIQTDYIKNEQGDIKVYQKDGSIYLSRDNEKDECLKKFIGIYDFEYTGYRIIGLSPDGKYLVYHSMEHMTIYGVLLDNIITGNDGKTYIMDIKSKKVAEYVDSYKIQWNQ